MIDGEEPREQNLGNYANFDDEQLRHGRSRGDRSPLLVALALAAKGASGAKPLDAAPAGARTARASALLEVARLLLASPSAPFSEEVEWRLSFLI